ncbi:PKD domain-containing protein [Corallococcus exercitus]|nr:PKD domain-containing protein [Corallococcus exercitus]
MHPRGRTWLLCVAVSLCAALVGCAGEEPVGSEPTGSAQIGVRSQELNTSEVTRVELTVTGSGMSTVTTNLDKTGGQWGGVVGNLPAGTARTFSAKAYNASNTVIYAGEATNITITAAQTTSVLLLLQQSTAPTPFVNSAPKITGVTVSPAQVEPNKPVALTLTATDADGDTLAYSWTATGGAFSNAAVSAPTWTAPATQGTYTVSVTVNDGRGGQAGISLQIAVVTATGSANVNVTFNTWPVVSQITGTPSGQVASGGVVTLDVSASDPDGDSLTYAWTDDCGGVFAGTASKSPSWTAPATAPSSGKCKTKVTVTDGRGGSTTGELTLNVGLVGAPNSVPVIDTTYQSSATVKSSSTVRLYATAHDPENTALTFTWSATGGVLGTPTTTAGRSEVVWTAPTTPQITTNYTVTVQVQDASGQKKSQEFVLQFPVCTKAVTSVLNRTNPFGVPLFITYQLVGGGGGGNANTTGSKGVTATGSFTLGASEGLDVIVGGGGGMGYLSNNQGGAGGCLL